MIEKTEFYYNADSGNLVKIPGSWEKAVRAAQKELLLAQGYLPVPGYEPPVTQLPFALVSESFSVQANGTVFCTRTEKPLPIKLSQSKLLRNPIVHAKMDELMSALTADSDLSAWWASDMRYLRGSPVAAKAMAAFGLTREQMEQIVLSCRE